MFCATESVGPKPHSSGSLTSRGTIALQVKHILLPMANRADLPLDALVAERLIRLLKQPWLRAIFGMVSQRLAYFPQPVCVG